MRVSGKNSTYIFIHRIFIHSNKLIFQIAFPVNIILSKCIDTTM